MLYVSGYAEARDAIDAGAEAGPALLYKPFTSHQLASRVRETLDDDRQNAQARA